MSMGTEISTPQELPIESPAGPTPEETKRQRRTMAAIIAVVVVIVLILVAFFIFLINPNTDPVVVARIRDMFIIYMALESFLIGIVLVILIVQLARLTNMVQNEILPILESTNETVSNVRGTSTFLSENLVEPVIKLNEYLAGFLRLLIALRILRK